MTVAHALAIAGRRAHDFGMNDRVKQVLDQAQKLSPEERAELLDLLAATMLETAPELHYAWAEEVEGRVDRLNRGDANLYDAEQTLAELRARCR